jgi:lipopolysaccharide biosynthesis glycosyltransferase
MEQINTTELNDESIEPKEDVLKSILGTSYKAYTELLELFDKNEMTYIWRYYKDGKAWLCKVEKKKRTIVWMSAWRGYTKATIYIPEKYIGDIQSIDVTKETMDKIKNTKNVGKSKPCMFDIRDSCVLEDFNKVMQFKIERK